MPRRRPHRVSSGRHPLLRGSRPWWLFGAMLLPFLALGLDPRLALRVVLWEMLAAGALLLLYTVIRIWRRYDPLLPMRHRAEPIELSDVKLAIGQTFTVRWHGGREGESVVARLVCRERTTRELGDGEATETRDFVADEARGRGDEALALRVPPDAMHSFRSDHNEIAWVVACERKPGGGRIDMAEAPVRVRPRLAGEAEP